MRSIRSRLLVTLLGLIAVVVLVLSWYLYNEMERVLDARTQAAEDLLHTQYEERRSRFNETFDEELARQAWRLAVQTYYRFEVDPVYPCQLLGLIPSMTTGVGHLTVPAWYSELRSPDLLRMFAKRTLEPMHLMYHDDEYFEIRYSGVTKRSPNLGEDCLTLSDAERQRLPENSPVFRQTNMKCGKDLRYVTVKFPVFLGPGRFSPRARPNRSANQSSSEPRRTIGNGGSPTVLVQVARETTERDRVLAEFRENLQKDLAGVREEAARAKRDLLNRLVLICIATIAGTALGITWISRRSLKPLVDLADAVSNVTPRDLRLKVNGEEPQAAGFPEELEPIVLRLQESFASLEHAFAREKRATADISHELRTPLASLLTTAQVALRKSRTVEEYRDTLRQCVETGSHLATLVERLLLLSRLDAGVDPLCREPVDVVELAGQCVDMLRPLANQKNIEVELEVDDSAGALEPIVGDASKLREIFVNLIDNAVNYNKPGGHVTVRIEAHPKVVMLEVNDTGMGMTPETRSHLFERFYRADPSRQSDTVNAGLGLAIVKGYVDLFGGRIDVESQLNVGSTFRITLPRVRAKVPMEQPV